MAAAREVIGKFWDIQNDGDYGALLPLFAEDAVFEDPIIGRVEGKKAIGELLNRLTKELADVGHFFEVLEIAGDEEVAWARWIWKRDEGDLEGVGLYRVKNGKLVSYRDFFDAKSAGG